MPYIKFKKDVTPFDENQRPHGEWIIYYDNDQLCYHENYVHGVFNGLTQGNHYNGTLWYRGNYNMGRQVGYWYINREKKYYLCLI